jgi:hypothetical protein
MFIFYRIKEIIKGHRFQVNYYELKPYGDLNPFDYEVYSKRFMTLYFAKKFLNKKNDKSFNTGRRAFMVSVWI